jgi:transketolase
MVLDADLAVDTGQMPSRQAFPERFVECGIAEMDMVSMAGGMALRGLTPVCHSFACFLSTRANEHIYNNATEHSHVVYVASLAGVLPGGPGHSHQSVRDISAVGGVPELIAIAPSSESEVALALGFCIHEHRGPAWLRLESVPCVVPYRFPDTHRLQLGVGTTLREGADVVFIGYGPVLLSEAYRAALALEQDGVRASVVSLPWLNRVDAPWLLRTIADKRLVVSVDNHLPIGGQGDRIAEIMAQTRFEAAPPLLRFAVETVPACGSNTAVLEHHGLSAGRMRERVLRALRG